jgi:hypothetical protein
MKQLLLTCAVLTLLPLTAGAVTSDIIGGSGDGAQTVHHCGFLPTTFRNYADSPATVGIVEAKLIQLGFLSHAGNGTYSKADKKAVIAFQKDEGLKADGIVNAPTAQRLAYVTHPSANVHRCYTDAIALR